MRIAAQRRRTNVWVVSHAQLVDWLQQQRNVPVDPDQARARLLSANLSVVEDVPA
jgi:hypothetical protein